MIPRSALSFLCLGLAPATALAQSWDAHLVGPTPTANGNLVSGLAASPTVVAFGQPRLNPNGQPGIQDTVRVFELAGGGWSEVAVLSSEEPIPSAASYGSALALEGDLLAVGDPNAAGSVAALGVVHLYRRGPSGWALEQVLFPSDGMAGLFGKSVDIEDGKVAVGAPTSSIATIEEGAVYIFEELGGAFVEVQRVDNPTPFEFGQFGADVDMQTNRLVIGSPGGALDGAAYVFEDAGSGSFSFLAQLLPSEPVSGGGFGNAVALDGELVAVGSPFACQSGSSCLGRVTIFDSLPGGWTEVAVLEGSAPNGYDGFGSDLEFEAGSLFVASDGSASAARFDPMVSGWVQTESYITSAGFTWVVILPVRLRSAGGNVVVTDPLGATVFSREVPAELEVVCPGDPHPLSNTGFPVVLDVKGELSLAEPTLPFWVVHDANLGPGLLFYGFGPASVPFNGTTLCVQGPVARAEGGAASTNGAILVIDLDLQSKPVVGSSMAILPGADVHFQYWFRVPGGGTHLSSSLRTVFVP